MDCFLCAGDLQEEQLKCSLCSHQLHYACGMGVEVPAEEFRISPGKKQYICPICIAASSYNRIHLVLARHEALSKQEEADQDADSNTSGDDDADSNDAKDSPLDTPVAEEASESHLSDIAVHDGSTDSQCRTVATRLENFRVRTSTANNSFDAGFREKFMIEISISLEISSKII